MDTEGDDIELGYFRDIDRREVDFVILRGLTPIQLIEVKSNDAEINPALRYLKVRFPHAEAWQISAVEVKDYVSADGIRVCPARLFLKGLI